MGVAEFLRTAVVVPGWPSYVPAKPPSHRNQEREFRVNGSNVTFRQTEFHGGGNTLDGAIGPIGGGGAIRHRAAIW